MLVCYSSSSESEDNCDTLAKVKLPSAKSLFLNGKYNGEELSSEDPDQHGGRTRSFAHERGIWATYCYFPMLPNPSLEEFQRLALELNLPGIDLELEPIAEPHLSLTRTVVLRHHWIESFVATLKEHILPSRERQVITLSTVKIYTNEEKSRTFISLATAMDHQIFLESMVAQLDHCLAEFNLPPFYENPSFHISVLWCLGDRAKELSSVVPLLNDIFQQIVARSSRAAFQLEANTLLCKIGNKLYRLE